MNVLIFGLGLHGGGYASASYFLDRGDTVRITDLRSPEQFGETLTLLERRGAESVMGRHNPEDFMWADIVVKNPMIPLDNPYLSFAKNIINDISWLLSSPWTEETEIIAITGTKGKTTTVAAVSHVLSFLGKEATQCGNMGISGFTVLSDWEQRKKQGIPLPEYLVCELSSWQIRDTYAIMEGDLPSFKVASLTNLLPDHQNAYPDLEHYFADKLELFGVHCETIVVADELRKQVAKHNSVPLKHIYGINATTKGVLDENSPLKPAYAICRSLGMRGKDIKKALATFKGVPHRIEHVGNAGPVMFINDSAATIPQAVGFSSLNVGELPLHLICGGTDKNLDPSPMLSALQEAASIHVLDGSFTQTKLLPLLKKKKLAYSGPFDTMDDAVASAYQAARTLSKSTGDSFQVVMLSPGAASFGLFLHEFDRGDQFRLRAQEKIAANND